MKSKIKITLGAILLASTINFVGCAGLKQTPRKLEVYLFNYPVYPKELELPQKWKEEVLLRKYNLKPGLYRFVKTNEDYLRSRVNILKLKF